ncbi:MAG TPA: anion transporter [Acetobacteraceae bacterium]|nr:anion transporter [Acetobacteraceae bacterium]
MERSAPRLARTVSLIAVAALLLVAAAAAAMPWLMPTQDVPARRLAAGAIFAASYVSLAVGKVPGLAIDRAGVALVGACLMVASGAMPLDQAYTAINLDTITLLLGMMIVVANLRLSGFFALANGFVARHAHRPIVLLAAVTLVSGVCSAFLVNDAICLVLAPLVTELTLTLRRNPVPYLLAVAMASNVGSVATITGNPQNIMIGSISHIPYTSFVASLAPVAAVGLAVVVMLIALLHRAEFAGAARLTTEPRPVRINKVLLARALAATALVIGLFFAGQPPAKAAIIVGALLLLTRRVRSSRIYAEIDWSLLLMFSGLFIIVAGAERTLLNEDVVAAVAGLRLDRVPVLTAITAVLSNLVSNVPAVLVIKPFVAALPDQGRMWLVIALASTLAGNFTVLASIANLIVVEKAARRGVTIGFFAYARVGVPLTLLTLVLGAWWLGR